MRKVNKLFHVRTMVVAIATSLLLSVAPGFADVEGAFEAPIRKGADNSRSVFLDIHPSETCSFGDLDLVLNELTTSGGSLRLQLTVEELGVKDGAVVYGQPLEKKFDGANMGTYEVRLPGGSDTKVYGVFLCSVTSEDVGKVPCSTRRLVPFAEMSRSYKLDLRPVLEGKGESAPYIPPPAPDAKLYFTQFLIDNGKSVWALQDSVSKEGAKVLKQLGVSQGKSEAVMPLVEKFSNTLGSLPLRAGEERLQMVLPFFSDKKCNG